MSDDSSASALPLGGALRNYRRWNGWFWFFLACIPLGFILPMVAAVIAFKIWGPNVSAPIGFSSVFWPLGGLAGALLLRGSRKRARRSLGIARLAEAEGWSYTASPPLKQYEHLGKVSFMMDPHSQKGKNLVQGQSAGLAWQSLDYEYTYFYGSVTTIGEQTLVIFPTGFCHLPEFAIVPLGLAGKLEEFFLGRGSAIESRQNKRFNKEFGVYGDDEPGIQRCLTRKLLGLFEDDPTLTVVVESGALYIFRRLTYVRAEDYGEFIAKAEQIGRLLKNLDDQEEAWV